ncbi:MAG: hypothetical protein AAF757_04780 [Cyanobacteria bacterium P01_D01_bin.116]
MVSSVSTQKEESLNILNNVSVNASKKSLDSDFKRQKISLNSPGIFDREPFDIRNYTDRLNPTKRKHRYECPVCGGHSLTINQKTGAYKCWSNECASKNIRELIAPELFNSSDYSERRSRKYKRKPKQEAPQPAPIPPGYIELAVLPYSPTPEPKINRGRYTEIKYPYSPTQWVLRKQNSDGKKITLPYHTTSIGKVICGKGDEKWQPYRWDEVLQYGVGKWVLGVEGEKDTDNSRSSLQIVSFTFQGSSWSEESLLSFAKQFKNAGVAGIIYDPDNDDAGAKKAEKLANACAKAQLPFIAINPVRLWPECPHKGDISDWIDSGKASVESLNQEIATAQRELLKPKNKVFSSHKGGERDQEIIEAASVRLDKLRKKISYALANPIRHITPKVKRRTYKPNVITYVPGKLPAVEKWKSLGKPSIQFTNASDRKRLLQEAIGKGYTEILDKSHPGLGKSYNAGEFTQSDFGVNKLIYQDINHRNASTSTVEDNFADIPVRNNGYKIDYTRSTPSGQPYRVRTKPGEQPDTPSNCHRTYIFDALRNKNYNDVFDVEESGISPICESCPLANQCKYSSGNGYGFRSQKRNAIKSSDNLRAHPDTAPLKIYNSDDEALLVGRIWEEAGVAINSIKKIEVSIDDLYATIGRLAVGDYPKKHKLKPLFEILEKLLDQRIKPNSRYGFDDSDIKKLIRDNYSSAINNLSDNNDIEPFADQVLYDLATYELEELEQALIPDLTFLQEKDGIDATSVEFKKSKTLRYANKEVAKQSARDAGNKALALPLYWLPEFILAWVGNGAFRCENGKLSIYTRDLRHKELAENAAFNLYLDATLSAELLRLKLGIQKPILEIEQAPPSYSNLNIVQVTGLGKLGKQRSDGLINRVDALKSALKKKHSNLGILEWKSNANNNEYYHFADGRGVNRFSNCDAIASFGIPYANVGELAAEYQVLTGLSDDDSIQEFITAMTDAEIVQEGGRLRSNRRKQEQLTFYFCADYDLSFLGDYFPGATLTKVDAFNITPTAGTQNQQTKLGILEAAKELINRGAKLTQQAIANTAEITQGTVSKIASQFGGWSSLKELFQTLLDSLYSDRNNFDGAEFSSPEKECIPGLIEYLPSLAAPQVSVLEALEALVEVLSVMGEKVFRAILHNLDPATRGKLLGKVLPCDSVEAQIILDLTPR